jgi:C4-dicarboxylate transporter DctQ subunit
MPIVTAVALLVLYGMSLPAVVDYVTFMKVQSTAYLKIRFDLLFSIYILFAVAMLIRYAWILWYALKGDAPEEFDPTKASSGV